MCALCNDDESHFPCRDGVDVFEVFVGDWWGIGLVGLTGALLFVGAGSVGGSSSRGGG